MLSDGQLTLTVHLLYHADGVIGVAVMTAAREAVEVMIMIEKISVERGGFLLDYWLCVCVCVCSEHHSLLYHLLFSMKKLQLQYYNQGERLG